MEQTLRQVSTFLSAQLLANVLIVMTLLKRFKGVQQFVSKNHSVILLMYFTSLFNFIFALFISKLKAITYWHAFSAFPRAELFQFSEIWVSGGDFNEKHSIYGFRGINTRDREFAIVFESHLPPPYWSTNYRKIYDVIKFFVRSKFIANNSNLHQLQTYTSQYIQSLRCILFHRHTRTPQIIYKFIGIFNAIIWTRSHVITYLLIS